MSMGASPIIPEIMPGCRRVIGIRAIKLLKAQLDGSGIFAGIRIVRMKPSSADGLVYDYLDCTAIAVASDGKSLNVDLNGERMMFPISEIGYIDIPPAPSREQIRAAQRKRSQEAKRNATPPTPAINRRITVSNSDTEEGSQMSKQWPLAGTSPKRVPSEGGLSGLAELANSQRSAAPELSVAGRPQKATNRFHDQVSRILELSKSTNNTVQLFFSSGAQFISPDLKDFRVEEYDDEFIRLSCTVGERNGTFVVDRKMVIGAMLLKS